MKIDIIPLPGLQRSFNIDAFLSSDCRSITVDESVYAHRVPHRYRFSLAHEVGHAVLHRPIFTALQFNTVTEYKRTLRELTDFDVNRMEWQAHSFAGLVLVPSPDLASHFDHAVQRAEAAGISVADYWDEAVDYISNSLVSVFRVSDQVISRRIEYDNLRARLIRR
jgi:Zn-dependent peptidase ImmA (M78 family)